MKLHRKFENTLPHHNGKNLANKVGTNRLTNHNKGYSPRLHRKRLQNFLILCDICEKHNKNEQKEASLHANSFNWNDIWEYRIHVNIAGPFPKKNNESKYIVVISDYFTKFTEIVSLWYIEVETITNTI